MHGFLAVTVFLLLQSIFLVTADPICSSIFGAPNFRDCRLLSVELSNGWPAGSPSYVDRMIHFFSLPGAEIPSWVGYSARFQKVILPHFGWLGKCLKSMLSLLLIFSSRRPVSKLQNDTYAAERTRRQGRVRCRVLL